MRKKPIDLKDMPGFNPKVPNGIDSVSMGDVFAKTLDVGRGGKEFPRVYPHCRRHGAMLRVSKEGIWRCGELGCHSGCYLPQT